LNEIFPSEDVAENTFTGMLTSPKLIVPEPIARALMAGTVHPVLPTRNER
jgi:hypothetical protein